MSDAEYALLNDVRLNGGAVLVREVTGDARELVRLLVERGCLVREGALDVAVYRLTEAGRVALCDFEQERQRRADQQAREEQHHRESIQESVRNRHAVLVSGLVGGILGAVVGFLLGRLFGGA